MEAILLVIIVILLIGLLGGSVNVKGEDNKEINLNEKLDKVINKIKEFFNKDK